MHRWRGNKPSQFCRGGLVCLCSLSGLCLVNKWRCHQARDSTDTCRLRFSLSATFCTELAFADSPGPSVHLCFDVHSSMLKCLERVRIPPLPSTDLHTTTCHRSTHLVGHFLQPLRVRLFQANPGLDHDAQLEPRAKKKAQQSVSRGWTGFVG